jgi:POLQ-like helicase
VAKRAVDIYRRNYPVASPLAASDPDEIEALHHLIAENFGLDSDLSKAALLGVFVHHGNTPQGIRLCVEHAMQKGKIKLVACTSTLAQGVNLPIRYLIACGTRQGGEPIKVRDFQNLMGRAGRAGMHTEGLVIFADPTVYDRGGSQFTESVNLLSPQHSEETTSSLLGVISPIKSRRGYESEVDWQDIYRLVFATSEAMMAWATGVERANTGCGYNAKEILKELLLRRKILASVESYLMANRGVEPFTAYRTSVERLAQATLAFHLANEAQRDALVGLFTTMADYLEEQEAIPEKQALYAKTLLGLQAAKGVEDWVAQRPQEFGEIRSHVEWLRVFWPLLVANSDDKFFHSVTPEGFGFELAEKWLNGDSYNRLIGLTTERDAKKPVGTQMHRLAEDDVIKFCETILGFDCSLILAAAIQFIRERENSDECVVTSLLAFQKALNYGLPDQLSVSAFEYGYADRIVAQKLASALQIAGYDGVRFATAIDNYWDTIDEVQVTLPSYFGKLVPPPF